MSFLIKFGDQDSEHKFGLLVAVWAKGGKVPKDLKDLKAQIAAAQIKADIPSTYTELQVFQPKRADILVLRLPEKSQLEAAEAMLQSDRASYNLPDFYRSFCGSLQADTADKREEFQKCRIGDYAIATCM